MKAKLLDITGARLRRLLMAMFLAVFFLTLSVPKIEAQFLEAGVVKLKVPVEAPDFRLKDLAGGEISSKELRGKVVILNFFGTA